MAKSPAVFSLHYLGSTRYYAALLQSEPISWEAWEHYPKQTFRNRCSIYGANGPLTLSVPTVRNGERVPMKDQRIANEERWQHLHWRSFEAAYRSSPYFEFFEDQLAPFYQKKYEFLFDFNLELHHLVCNWLNLPLKGDTTTSYEANLPEGTVDWREAFPAKGNKAVSNTPEYIQVFGDRYGYISDLSILDLLFNQGPSGADNLRQITL